MIQPVVTRGSTNSLAESLSLKGAPVKIILNGINSSELCAVDAKHPIILDGRHPLVKFFVHHLHALYCHQGSDYVRAQLQQRCFILRIRSLLRPLKSDCFVCRKRKAETLAPMMAGFAH